MGLLDLPTELFQPIVTNVVRDSVPEAFRLRLVCKAFDADIQRTIYALLQYNSYCIYSLPYAMIRRLILSKLVKERALLSYIIKEGIEFEDMIRENARQRPLCFFIIRTLEYLEIEYNMVDADCKRRCIEGLVTAMAFAFVNREQFQYGLALTTPTKNRLQFGTVLPETCMDGYFPLSSNLAIYGQSNFSTLRQGALVATLMAGETELAKRMLDNGVDATKKSCIFGSPMFAAGYMGLNGIIRSILTVSIQQTKLSDSHDHDSSISNNTIMLKNLNTGVKKERFYSFRPQITAEFQPRTPEDFALLGAVSGNRGSLVRSILGPAEPQDQLSATCDAFSQPPSYSGIITAIYDAVIFKHLDIVFMLVQYNASRNLQWFTNDYHGRLYKTQLATLQQSMDVFFQNFTFSNPDPEKFPFFLENSLEKHCWTDFIYPVQTRSIKKIFGVKVVQQLLSEAGAQWRPSLLENVLEHGADLNYRYHDRLINPLVRAAGGGHWCQLYYMIEQRGADLDNDHCGSQALALAINKTAALGQGNWEHVYDCIDLLRERVSVEEALDGLADGRPIPNFIRGNRELLKNLDHKVKGNDRLRSRMQNLPK